MLTKKEIKALRSLWFTERQIYFINDYLRRQKELQDMDKKCSLIEILGLQVYNDFVVALED